MDRLYKGVWDKVNSGGAVGQALFQFAYNYKLRQIEKGYDTPFLNKYVVCLLCPASVGLCDIQNNGNVIERRSSRFLWQFACWAASCFQHAC